MKVQRPHNRRLYIHIYCVCMRCDVRHGCRQLFALAPLPNTKVFVLYIALKRHRESPVCVWMLWMHKETGVRAIVITHFRPRAPCTSTHQPPPPPQQRVGGRSAVECGLLVARGHFARSRGDCNVWRDNQINNSPWPLARQSRVGSACAGFRRVLFSLPYTRTPRTQHMLCYFFVHLPLVFCTGFFRLAFRSPFLTCRTHKTVTHIHLCVSCVFVSVFARVL